MSHETDASSHDDDEMASFVALAREAINDNDPPPSDVSALAKLAFEFRGIETVELADERELAGIRSAVDAALQAGRGETTIIWSVSEQLLVGVVHTPITASVTLQTPTSTLEAPVDIIDGSFEIDAPTTPYRIIVDDGSGPWATPWTD